jgi:GTPase SAR1 family protein
VQSSQGCLLCFSITNRQSFDHLNVLAEQVYRLKDTADIPIVRWSADPDLIKMKNSILHGRPKQVVVGCMGDIEDERQVSDTEAADWAQLHRAEYILTSAKTGLNVEAVFEFVVCAGKR